MDNLEIRCAKLEKERDKFRSIASSAKVERLDALAKADYLEEENQQLRKQIEDSRQVSWGEFRDFIKEYASSLQNFYGPDLKQLASRYEIQVVEWGILFTEQDGPETEDDYA